MKKSANNTEVEMKKFLEGQAEILPEKLEDATVEDMLLYLVAREYCYMLRCDKCPCKKLKNNDKISCFDFQAENIMPLLLKRQKHQKEPQTEVKEAKKEDTYYKQTITFMKNRGYSHCYMCGGDLK